MCNCISENNGNIGIYYRIICPSKKILLINTQGKNRLFCVVMTGTVQRQVCICGWMQCCNNIYNNGFTLQRLLFECVHWVPSVERNVYSDSTYWIPKIDWFGFSFSRGDLWQIITIRSTNRLPFFKLCFCPCKSTVTLVNQPCHNSFQFFLSRIWSNCNSAFWQRS